MDIDSPSATILSLPNELLTPTLSLIKRHDLMSLRLTCHQLSNAATPPLFKTITTTWSRLHQLLLISNSPTLAPLVEQLIFQEQCFNVGDRDPWPYGADNREVSALYNTIIAYHGRNDTVRTNPYGFMHIMNEEGPSSAPPPKYRPELEQHFIEEMICAVLREYKKRDDYQSSEAAFFRLFIALKGLPNVTVVSTVDARAGGYLKSLPACEELLQLNDYFPIQEGSFYMMFRKWPSPTQKGVLMLLRVFASLQRPIELSAGSGDDGLMRMGAPLEAADVVPEVHMPSSWTSNVDAANGFNYLRKLQLCVSKQGEERYDPIRSSLVAQGLARADQLEELRVGADHMWSADMGALVPMLKEGEGDALVYAQLKVLQLERFGLTLPGSLVRVLKSRVPGLCVLSFVECTLHGQRWKDVLQEMSDDETFTLHEFRLEGSSCKEDIEMEKVSGTSAVGPCAFHGILIPSIVSSQALTHFVNTPGAANPLASRKWSSPNQKMLENSDLAATLAAQGIEYGHNDEEFENTSEWSMEDRSQPGREWSDEDSDGPEFDEDYDFSAEESSDDEMDIDVDAVRIAGKEVAMETKIHVHRNLRERGLRDITAVDA